jgi:hypothetical protein
VETLGTVIAILCVAVILMVNVYTFVVCWQKGRQTLFLLGCIGLIVPLLGICHWIGALRLARPDSSWAQRRYDEAKMNRAYDRFGYLPFPPLVKRSKSNW